MKPQAVHEGAIWIQLLKIFPVPQSGQRSVQIFRQTPGFREGCPERIGVFSLLAAITDSFNPHTYRSATLECGSLLSKLPPCFGEACFALRNYSLLTPKTSENTLPYLLTP